MLKGDLEHRCEVDNDDEHEGDYNLSCCLSSRTRASTSTQSLVIALSCTFVDGNRRSFITIYNESHNSTHTTTTTGHSACS